MIPRGRENRNLRISKLRFGTSPSSEYSSVLDRRGNVVDGWSVGMNFNALCSLSFRSCLRTTRNSVYSLECHLSLLLTCNVCRCIMSLIRGVMGKFPCPICLVPRAELHNLLETWPLRTRHDSVRLLRKARRKYTKAKREKKLKSQSLRDVEVSII